MKLYQYMLLSETEQWNTLWDSGKFLGHIISADRRDVLYGLGEFFVEVHYDSIEEKIISKKQFRRGPFLDRYLDKIPLDLDLDIGV